LKPRRQAVQIYGELLFLARLLSSAAASSTSVSSLSSSLSLCACALDGGGYGVRRWWLWCAHAVVVADREGAGTVVCTGPETMVAVAASGGCGGERRARGGGRG